MVEGGPVLEGTAVEPEMTAAAGSARAAAATAAAAAVRAMVEALTCTRPRRTCGGGADMYNDARHVATYEDAAEDVSESCTICMSRPRALRFLPCRHAVMCEDCAMA